MNSKRDREIFDPLQRDGAKDIYCKGPRFESCPKEEWGVIIKFRVFVELGEVAGFDSEASPLSSDSVY
jgi:hypothetical protein